MSTAILDKKKSARQRPIAKGIYIRCRRLNGLYEIFKYIADLFVNMFQLVKSMRIPECLLVLLLGFIGFKYASIPQNMLVLVTLFFVVAATMLQNDWRDRVHDLKKGKKFAFKNPRLFIFWVIFSWIICLSLIGTLYLQHPSSARLLLTMAFIGFIYSETRTIPLLSVSLVTLSVASSTLIPLTFGADFSTISPLFFATGLIMFGRETLHDVADLKADKEYKKTLPIVFGSKFARILSTISLIVGCIFAIIISPISLIGTAFILLGLIQVIKDVNLTQVRKFIDIGLIALIIGLAFK